MEENSDKKPIEIKGLDPVKLEVTMDADPNNPWSVEDASAFLKYCCPECDYQILNLQMFSDHALENHAKSVTLFGDQVQYKTEDIENDFIDNVDTFEDHQEMDTSEILPMTKVESVEPLDLPNQCNFCDFSSTLVPIIIQHHNELHEDESPPFFKCNHCEFYHKKKRTVQDHSRKVHNKHFIPYKCKTCGKKIGKIETFRDHLKAANCAKSKKGNQRQT